MAVTEDPDRLSAALAYLRRGWSVIPIEARGKRPLMAWRPFQTHLAEVEAVRGWFERWPEANVAIVTGGLSGLVVVDIDPRHGGLDSIAALERECGPLPATLEAVTGGGGRHLYFRYPGISTPNRVGLRPGVDLRGDGGCIVAPPSVHPSGRRYTWAPGHSPDDMRPARMPAWLVHPQPTPAGRSARRRLPGRPQGGADSVRQALQWQAAGTPIRLDGPGTGRPPVAVAAVARIPAAEPPPRELPTVRALHRGAAHR